MLIGAPHSSNWDGIWGFAAKLALGLDIKILGKDSLFKVPVMGAAAAPPGRDPGRPQRRARRGRAVGGDDPARRQFWYGLAPEGTRKPVERWKTGFWKIAKAAEVPVLPAYFHYGRKVIGIGPVFELGDDMAADIARIREWYRSVSKGKWHDA